MQAMHLRHYRPGAILTSNLGSKYSIINQSMPKFKKVGELHFSGIDGTIVVGEIIITVLLNMKFIKRKIITVIKDATFEH